MQTKRCYQIFLEKKKTTKKEKAALWCPLDIFVNTSLQHDPLIITTKLTFQSTKRPTGFSPNISHKLNNNWLKWLCNQSCQWEKNNGLCNICNIMKTAITTCNITVSPQSQQGTRISVMYWSNNQKLMG